MRVTVIGLGKLGLCTAACLASKGHRVIGVDNNPAVLASLRQRQNPISEPGLDDLLSRSWSMFSVTENVTQAVQETDLTLIIVPTPSGADGRFINTYVIAALESVAPALAAMKSYHVVDVISTVMPRSSDGEFIPLLERTSGKRCGPDFGFAYNPEFIALGSVIHDFLNPDMVLIGESDSRAGTVVESLYASICDNTPCFSRMSLINAEVTKLSLNCFLTMKISFANELAAVCEHIPGADVDVISAALGADTRIGSRYLQGGLGFGGPCFPRDNRAFAACAEGHGYQTCIGPQVIAVNHGVLDRLARMVHGAVQVPGSVALLGLSYKEDTHIVEESQPIQLALRLADDGYKISVYDPQATESARAILGDRVHYAPSALDCAQGAEVILLMTAWPQIRTLPWKELAAQMEPPVALIDCWRIVPPADRASFHYQALGLGPVFQGDEP
ncbi:UDP-glucose dehydrogenase family protein [Allochromatium vinosum]|uniref:UDP-glucose dehydrogenase family protein n=1 Tax=Allochromatium vinosum TaxID=1049 RepID=UPI0019036D53|nr:nucleotide sugar dehydrogenase [Allochromatium vinosum]MBK1656072.1 hypothetical protein [Allochromatium vinosum]